jgi:ribosomal protein S27E
MQVIQVKCPNCRDAIYSKQKDSVFYCQKCGTMHERNGGAKVVDYEIADFNKQMADQKAYMPFWRIYATLKIDHVSVAGGSIRKLRGWIKGDEGGGTLFVYVPATPIDKESFRRMAIDLTTMPPQYRTRLDFANIERLPTSISREEATRMADFVLVTIEAEKSGVLQELDYTMTVHDARMVYLPFARQANGLTIALG